MPTEPALRCRPLRAQPGSAGHPVWQLRSDAADQRRRGQSQDPEATAPDLLTAIIERYRRRESSVEKSLIEMYLAGISVRVGGEDITEALWGTRVSPSTVSNLNKKIYAKIEAWRNRRIEGEHPYLYLDGIVMKRTWAGEVGNVSTEVASAVNSEGFREILGICEGAAQDKSGWSAFLRHLVDRGLNGVQGNLRRLPRLDGECRGICPTLSGSAAWFIFIGTSSAMCRPPGSAR